MLLKMFSVYDSKAEAYLQPFYANTTALAVRMFTSACNNPEQDFNKYAADYTLFEIGTFETDTGIAMAYTSFNNLGTALTYIDDLAIARSERTASA